MATTKLNLPTISGNMSADVVRDMNALAEAIDAKAGVAGGHATLGVDGKVPASQLNVDTSNLATKTEFNEHKADETAHDIGDKNTLLTTDKTTIVSAMNELFTNANNGKTDIASVIGSPATSGDTFTQLKTHIQNSKNDLATNLSAKGQSSTGTETLDALVDKVALVNTGKKVSTGLTSSADTNPGMLSIRGLSFRPALVVAYATSTNEHYAIYNNASYYLGKTLNIYAGSKNTTPVSGTASYYDDGFDITVSAFTRSYRWVAVE